MEIISQKGKFMNELQIFNSSEFGQIRTVTIDNEPWFVGYDVADALGYKNQSDAVLNHVDEDDRRVFQKSEITTLASIPNRGLTCINESGLYSLILGSKLESAKRFKHWVTSEVLPTIRKTGSYQKPLTQQEIMRIQLGMIDDHEDRILNLENNMTIDYGQQQVLGDTVNKAVIDALGGKDSEAYRTIAKKVFAECNRDLKHYFNVNARNNVPKLKFDEAIEYAKNWKPSTNTLLMIRECNAQFSI